MKYVFDSGVAVKVVVPETDYDKAIRLRNDFRAGIHQLLAPDILPGEVGHALTKAERQLRITVGESALLWQKIMATPPHLSPSLPLLLRSAEHSLAANWREHGVRMLFDQGAPGPFHALRR